MVPRHAVGEEIDAAPAAAAAEFVTYLEYDYDGEKYQTVTVLNEDWSDTGIYMIIRTAPALKVLYYTCLNE